MTAEQHANLYEQHEWKHPTQVAGIPWKNPVATASGTFQYAAVRWFYDVSQLGAVTTKGVSPVPWEGNPGIRTAEGPSSNINAVGLQNPGVDHYLEDDLPKLKAINATVIANVAGHCDDDYAEVVSKLDDSPADMLEINVSCPNVSAGGMSVGTDPVALSRLITRLRKLTDKKMIVKLTPNVTDITVPARAAVEHGADALSMINTLKDMRINIRTGKPIIANVTGGVSGPAVLPVGLAAVYRVRTALPEIPIIGLGGIGQTVAGIANAFGMKVSAWNSHVPAQVFENLNVTPVEDMNELISNSDVVSVHMPLLDSTRGIITAKNLDALRPGTLFVNTARAEVIEPGALLARLQRGDIPAALDVFDHEPLAADDPLCKIPGIVLTPHIAWRTDGAYIGMTKQVVQSIAAFFKGEEFNVVV